MKLVATACIRAANFGEAHGGIYLVDVESGTVEKNIPWSMEVMSRDGWNDRGGDRGLRGMIVRENDLVMADAYGLMVFDRELNLIRRVENKDFFHSLHEICEFNDSVWATSTWYNVILELDKDSFDIKNCYHIYEEAPNKYAKRLVDSCKDLEHIHHLNSVSAFAGRLVFSGTNVPGLIEFDSMEFLVGLDKRAKHNFYEYKDYILLNDTANEKLMSLNKQTLEMVNIPIPRQPNVKVVNDVIATDNFLRGMARSGERVFLGSSPARIVVVNLTWGEVEKTIELSTDIKCSIHGLEIFEEDND